VAFAAVRAQSAGALGGRLPLEPGSWWVLATSAGERLELRASEGSARSGDERVVRVDASNGDYRLLALASDGSLRLLEQQRFGRAPTSFDPALVVLPPGGAAEGRHEHETTLRSFDPSGDSEPQPGRARIRVTAGRPEAVRTPAGQFTDCLPVEVVLALDWQDGSASEHPLRVWLAPGVGPVRVVVAGSDARRAADLRLLEASVGDRRWPADR
jgi:hypothetical protein